MQTTDYDLEQKLEQKHIYTKYSSPKSMLLLLLSAIAAVSVGGCSSVPANVLNSNSNDSQGEVKAENKTNNNSKISTPAIFKSTGDDPNFVVKVVDNVGPAVVRIDTSKTVRSQLPDEFNDPFFRRFFGNRLPSQSRQRVQRGNGSGFIINSNGEILTNAHVVNGADTVTVKLKDGRQFDGKVLGEDQVTDVAVIKIDAEDLPTVSLGNSESLRPGEAVIAIGNPLGLDYTVTSGILSATGRSSADIGASDKRVDYLQTDAAINPGNSGGPLLNAQGEVIGMNTAIIRGAQGLGFAIPINTVQRISQELIAKGSVDHPYLGVVMVTLNKDLKQRLNSELGTPTVETDKGVLLVRVVPRSPAARAGLKAGDVIVGIDNQNVTKNEEVQKIVEKSKIGVPLQVQIERNGQTRQIAVSPGPLPVQQQS
ncbi:MAG: HhoA/HhoB/HtrA family serine endopeptidase [Nostocaceae cyanobacterium]|nr:HhoA/HhoB/HtrA family serine endopeptidase [Nostocaceae cyanobacterium]